MKYLKSRISDSLRRIGEYAKIDVLYLASGGSWLTLEFLFTSIGGIILYVLYAHALTKDALGTYQYVLSLIGLITSLSLTGMNPAVIQSVARGREGIFIRSIRVQLQYGIIPAIVAVGIGAYYAYNAAYALSVAFFISAIALPIIQSSSTYQAFFMGRKDFKSYFWYSTLFTLLYTIGMVIALVFTHSGTMLASVYFVLTACIGAGLCALAIRANRPNDVPDDANIGYGKHLSVMGILPAIGSRLDSVLVFHFLGPVDLALYTFAKLIPEKMLGPLKSISSIAFPKFSERAVDRASLARKSFFVLLVALSIAGAYVIAAPYIFALLFPQYLYAVPYSQVLALILVTSASYLPSTALMAESRIQRLYALNSVYPILQISILAILLFYFGLWGAILARLASSLLLPLLSTVLVFAYPRNQLK